MAWCPKCKYEYVEGIKICPDCKAALVESLDDSLDNVDSDNIQEQLEDIYEAMPDEAESYDEMYSEESTSEEDVIKQLISVLKAKGMTEEEIKGMIENAKRKSNNSIPPYKCVKDKLEENKSASLVLILVGILGLSVILLNALGVLKLPLVGFSLVLTSVVMGVLFAIFILSGFRSIAMVKKLTPMAEKESELIEECVNLLKKLKSENAFDIENEDLSMEESSLLISNMAVNSLENNIDDLPPGFSYYVVDRFYSEIFEENED